jgi:2-dehydropantoate 2-reductase
MTGERIWVVGAGAIGSIVAGKLPSDPPCVLIDGWREHIDAINASGLEIDYGNSIQRVRLPTFHADDLAELSEKPDIILLAVKSNSTEKLLRALRPLMTDKTLVVSLQNGLNEEVISATVRADRTIGAVVTFGGELIAPGRVRGYGDGRHLVIGELDGTLTPRLDRLAQTLSPSVSVEETSNIWGELWSKLVVNAEVNPVCAVTGLTTNEVAADPLLRRIALSLAREAVQVAHRLGMTLNPAYLDGPVEAYLRSSDYEAGTSVEQNFIARWSRAGVKPSMLQDVEKCRPTEIDFLNGYVLEKARAVGLPAPVNELIIRLTKSVETSQRSVPYELLRNEFETTVSRSSFEGVFADEG